MGTGWKVALFVVVVITVAGEREASAQLGALVSPGRLSQPHAELEGVGNCLKCHAAGRQVAVDKCLSCHRPIADRIARRSGIHRDAGTGCVRCHVEHAGVDAELRPFDQQRFDHARDASFAIDGLHASVSCAACHKTRSFLAVSASCASCHADPHKGSLGASCTTCHSTSAKFAAAVAGFDHNRTAYPLIGAHAPVACAKCHVNKAYKGIAFSSCANCHTDPHRPKFAAACSTCHTSMDSWRTEKVEHARTAFPLRGKHATVACAKCHLKPALAAKPKAEPCAACHTDPHRGVFKQDCGACHTESGFQKGTFDHNATTFPLADKHAGLQCVSCHKGPAPAVRTVATRAATATPIDYRGLKTACESCHSDVHKAELGARCDTCHNAKTFAVTTYQHAKPGPFFAGQHAPVKCVDCHTATYAPTRTSAPVPALRVGFIATSTTCAACHRDVHLGQVGDRCERCHTIEAVKFAVTSFAHQNTTFALTGKHAPLACEACHKVETHSFPLGTGTARRLTGIGTECASCHQDPHAGQLDRACQTCHTNDTFLLPNYVHRNARGLRAFFAGKHLSATCKDCHKPAARAGGVVPVVYRVGTACTTCHTDVHRGALGPNCDTCHRP